MEVMYSKGKTNIKMEISIRHQEPVECDGFRIKIHGNEFLLKETAAGLHIFEVKDDCIMVQPQTANSIVLITKEKTSRKKK